MRYCAGPGGDFRWRVVEQLLFSNTGENRAEQILDRFAMLVIVLDNSNVAHLGHANTPAAEFSGDYSERPQPSFKQVLTM